MKAGEEALVALLWGEIPSPSGKAGIVTDMSSRQTRRCTTHTLDKRLRDGDFNVVDRLEDFDAPIVGIMQNRFRPGDDIARFAGRIETKGVEMEPIFDDVLGERSREGLSDFGKDLDQLTADALGIMTAPMTTTKLPTRAMFLKGVAYEASDNEFIGSNAPAAIHVVMANIRDKTARSENKDDGEHHTDLPRLSQTIITRDFDKAPGRRPGNVDQRSWFQMDGGSTLRSRESNLRAS